MSLMDNQKCITILFWREYFFCLSMRQLARIQRSEHFQVFTGPDQCIGIGAMLHNPFQNFQVEIKC
jgi:hypothetical protein